MSWSVKLRTLLALGLPNVARVGAYRVGLETGLGRVRRLKATLPQGPFFASPNVVRALPASQAWDGEACYFGYHRFPLKAGPPDWFANPLTGTRLPRPDRPWWEIPDFDPAAGDIKVIWEPSRFYWALALAERAAAGDAAALPQLEAWLADWCGHNPSYLGPNWKCGQETSIRVMHLCMTALLLGNAREPTKSLQRLIAVHLERVEPTIGYAIGQDNNHGTSEAAALFIGGNLLAEQGDRRGARWARLGRRLIENRAARLISPDGSFSQYSLTYHRVLLDTFVMAEAWRRQQGLLPFSKLVQERLAAAANWLFVLVDASSGDGPNLGANDGARLLPLTDTDYRDFRPTVQSAMALFAGKRAYAEAGPWDRPLAWLGLAIPNELAGAPESCCFDDGGYAILKNGRVTAVLRYPRFRFRPAQADALHVDLWRDGRNLLRDAGTYSYNANLETLAAFAGTAGHNTVQFDGRDQMPRLGRFLFGEWLKTDKISFAGGPTPTAAASYTDWRGARHVREITLLTDRLIIRDRLEGNFGSATLRWRLAPGAWSFEGFTARNGSQRLTISGTERLHHAVFAEGAESLYYLEQHKVPVLEIDIDEAGEVTTEYFWQ